MAESEGLWPAAFGKALSGKAKVERSTGAAVDAGTRAGLLTCGLRVAACLAGAACATFGVLVGAPLCCVAIAAQSKRNVNSGNTNARAGTAESNGSSLNTQ